MTTLEILKGARELISRPGGHTQGAMARTAMGIPIDPWDPEATCHCDLGALEAVCRDVTSRPFLHAASALRAAARQLTGDRNIMVSGYNDEHNQAENVALYDLAIRIVQQHGEPFHADTKT